MFGHLPKISQNYWPLKVPTCVQRVCVAVNSSAASRILLRSSPVWGTYCCLSRLLDPSFTLQGFLAEHSLPGLKKCWGTWTTQAFNDLQKGSSHLGTLWFPKCLTCLDLWNYANPTKEQNKSGRYLEINGVISLQAFTRLRVSRADLW